MREQLIQYVNLLFAGASGAEDIKQEILQNTLDRYDDLVSQGKSPQAAYQLAISGIGDIHEILGSRPEDPVKATPSPSAASFIQADVELKDDKKNKLIKAIAIACLILSAIPILLLENSIGVCACLAMVAVAVVVLIVSDKDSEEKPRTTASEQTKHTRSAINRGITGGIWGTGLCAYFLLSFSTGAWHITWLLFPILGCICGFVDACFDLSRKPVGAIIRLILFLVLTGLLVITVLGLHLGNIVFSGFFSSSISGPYNTSEGSVAASEIRNLQIDWVAGSITIQTADTDTITFTEGFYGEETKPMIWKQSGDKLILQFSESAWGFGFMNNSSVSKDLVVTVPSDWNCNDLSIDSVSAEIQVSDLVCDSIDLNNVSGKCDFENCKTEELTLETVSGKVNYRGELNSMDCDSVSADCEIYAQNCPSEIDMDGVSCDLILYLPENCGFTVDMDTASGDFDSDFPTTSKGGKHIYGDGECEINADSASGNICIRKAG